MDRQEPQNLAPIKPADRIEVMDVLRGVALIGILFMNIEWFGRPMPELGWFDQTLTGLDHAAGWLVRCFVEGKFYKLFTLLFGMGFAVMLLRARELQRPFTAWFVRRMLVLYIIGILHMVFLWGGDIVHDYAVAGLLLLGLICLLGKPRFQKYDKPKTFLKVALIWLLLPFIVASIFGIGFGSYYDNDRFRAHYQEQQDINARVAELEAAAAEEAALGITAPVEGVGDDPQDSEDEEIGEDDLSPEELLAKKAQERFKERARMDKASAEDLAAYRDSRYWKATKYRFAEMLKKSKFSPFFALFMLLPLFMLGYWFISSGVLRESRKNSELFKGMALMGTGFGLIVTVAGLLILQHPAAKDIMTLTGVGMALFQLGQLLMAAGYLGIIVVLFHNATWTRWLRSLAPMGRMALTNYIMQTLILSLIFHGYAGGLFGEISRAPQMLIVLVIVALQLVFSMWWLSKYRFGPLEWIWRSLSYKKAQAMRIHQ